MAKEICIICENRFNVKPKFRVLGKTLICGFCRKTTPPMEHRCVFNNVRNERCKGWKLPNEQNCFHHGR